MVRLSVQIFILKDVDIILPDDVDMIWAGHWYDQ